MRIAIAGGGWAGLSAAAGLARRGMRPVVFEASDTLGGRARTIRSPRLGMPIDNGQHILLGAYTETLELIRSLTGDTAPRLLRLPLSLRSADGAVHLQAGALPAPWHLVRAIARARGISPAERVKLAGLFRRAGRECWSAPADWTVARWLDHHRQPPRLIRCLWRPLCLAALNTPPGQACARTFCRVLGEALGGSARAGDVLIPRLGLSELWTNHLPAMVEVRRSSAVTHLARRDTGVAVNGEAFDALVLACPPPAAARLLGAMAPDPQAGQQHAQRDFLRILREFDYLPIATLTLKLDRPWHLPCPMLMLFDSPERCHYGQWLFDLSRVAGAGSPQACCATVVVSDARGLMRHSREEAVAGIIEQIGIQTRRLAAMPEILGHELIVEKRATFAAVPGLERPGNASPWPRIWVAGDWTDTGYPAVLEGAVRSGLRAAGEVLSQPGLQRKA